MEWIETLGTEAVAVAVAVALMIGWLVRGLRVKPQFKEYDARITKLERKLAAVSETDSALKAAQTVKIREEVFQMQRKRRLQDYGDMIGSGGLDD